MVTESELTIRRVPIDFLEIELAVLEEMGVDCDRTPEYAANNARTRLVDLTVRPSKLEAPINKIHPMRSPASTSTTSRSSRRSPPRRTARP
ncbi:hypothetical protein SBADM41S_02475 [Streptomyces badius]